MKTSTSPRINSPANHHAANMADALYLCRAQNPECE